MRAIYRFLIVIVSILILLPFLTKRNGKRIAQRWSQWIMKRWHMNVIVHGHIPSISGVLYAANHKSFIEGIALLSLTPVSIVAKSEVKNWPIIGWAMMRIDTVFVTRDNKASRKDARTDIKHHLLDGKSVLIFPEGTTRAGSHLHHFYSGSFTAAGSIGTFIIPLTVYYDDDSVSWDNAVRDESFLQYFWRVFNKKTITLHLDFGPPINSFNAEESATMTKDWIQKRLDKAFAT